MDPFVLIIVGSVGALIAALVLLGKYYPGTGADVLDWKPTRSVETEAELELDDIQQMLDAQNERRKRTGRPEVTEDQIRARVAAEQREEAELRARARRELGHED
jgi:hypothetical protein